MSCIFVVRSLSHTNLLKWRYIYIYIYIYIYQHTYSCFITMHYDVKFTVRDGSVGWQHWFHNLATLPSRLVSADFGTCSYHCSLCNCALFPHMLKSSSTHTLLCHFTYYHVGSMKHIILPLLHNMMTHGVYFYAQNIQHTFCTTVFACIWACV